jgi:hypothetical protein
MRTVSDAAVSVVKSVRLPRTQLICRIGSARPHRISVSLVWNLASCACTVAPGGGPQGRLNGPACDSAHKPFGIKGRDSSLPSPTSHSPPFPEQLRPLPFELLSPPSAVEPVLSSELSREGPAELARRPSSSPAPSIFVSSSEEQHDFLFFSARRRRPSPLSIPTSC